MQAEGYGADIAFDGAQIRITAKSLLSKGALGAGNRGIPVTDLVSLDFKNASMLANGHIELTTNAGRTAVHFWRKQSESMRLVYQEIRAAVPNVPEGPSKAPFANALRDRQLQREAASPPAPHPPVPGPISPATVPQSTPRAEAPAAPVRVGQYRQPPPRGRSVEAWSTLLTRQDVVGESHYEASFKQLLQEYGITQVQTDGVELDGARAALVHEPDNPYDSSAVAVWIDGRHQVGHLAKGKAARYAPKLDALGYGTYLDAPARVWIGQDDDGRLYGSATVRIPEPDGIVPFNDLPEEPLTVLPGGSAIQVQGEEDHMDVLESFGLGSAPRHVAATLHIIESQKTPRSAVQMLVEVRLDGERVGVLTKGMSDQVRDLVTFVAEKGRVPVARAIVKGSALRADVVLYVARTVDVKQRWLDAVEQA
jgi:hypothetical protein